MPLILPFVQDNKLYGLGLRSRHFEHIIANKPNIGFFEIISENYINCHGTQREMLDIIREHYPVAMHGVSLSIGSSSPLDMTYLARLRSLMEEIKPLYISDHLCWTGINGINTHDLLPVPLNRESLEHVTARVKQVQNFLGRQILLENPSSYLTFRADEIPEYEFMAEMAEKAECGVLLDVNNIYVSSFNHRISAKKYLDAIAPKKIGYVHLAGHKHMGSHIVDTHDRAVSNEVWELYSHLRKKRGDIPTLVEWDGDIPEFSVLESELEKARLAAAYDMDDKSSAVPCIGSSNHGIAELQGNLQNAILNADLDDVETWVADKPGFSPAQQVDVYITGYRLRLRDMLMNDYPVTLQKLGKNRFIALVGEFVNNNHSTQYDITRHAESFAGWLEGQKVRQSVKDTARLERDAAVCYSLPANETISAAAFSGITPQELLAMKLPLIESAILYSAGRTRLVIYRSGADVFQLKLKRAEFDFLQAVNSGADIAQAIKAAGSKAKPDLYLSKFLHLFRAH